MDPLVVWLVVFWAIVLLTCFGWLLSCCVCGLCCPRRLQRWLGVLAVVLLIGATLGTAVATHRLEALWTGSKTVVADTIVLARFARKSGALAAALA